MFTKVGTLTVVVNPLDDTTLLVQRAVGTTWGGLWVPAGGKADENELKEEFEFNLLEKSAIREVKEETNIDVVILKYVCSFAHNIIENNIGKILMVVYVATPTTYDVHPQLEEVADVKWFTFNDAIEMPLVDGMDLILQQVYSERMWEVK